MVDRAGQLVSDYVELTLNVVRLQTNIVAMQQVQDMTQYPMQIPRLSVQLLKHCHCG